MIPKIIHYCWLSNDPFPKKIQKCLESWNKKIPNYTFILWNLDRCREENILTTWVKEAFELKKYAFASDYIRLYAVYKYGGIYLDTDIEIIKPFDDLLHLPYFIGREAVGNRVEIAAFGAQKHTRWIKDCLDYYSDRHFIKENGTLDMRVMPDIIYERINTNYIIKNIENINFFDLKDNIFNQFPNDWFCANIYLKPEDEKPSYIVSDSTYCIHHFANSWLYKNKLDYIKYKLQNHVHVCMRFYYRLLKKIKNIFLK